jgi:tetratricopeptide (TPR) repeat protein
MLTPVTETPMDANLSWPNNDRAETPGTLQFVAPQAISPKAQQSFREGMAHLQSGEAALAVAALSQTIEHAPGFTAGHVFLGIAHALTSNIYPALDHLEIATKLEPDNFAAHYTLAQLNFKLRIPQRGYEEAEKAMHCHMNLEQRKLLNQLLREERARERNGIARPWFNKPFNRPMLFLAGSGMVAATIAALMHMH